MATLTLNYSGYASGRGGIAPPRATTHYGDLRQRYGVDWEVLTAAGLTVAMVGYGSQNISDTKQLLLAGAAGRGVPPLVCGCIAGTQAHFAERYHTCDGAMEFDTARSFDSDLHFHVPPLAPGHV